MFKIWLPDCGIPSNEAYSMEKVKEWDGIGITRGMHITCSSRYAQQGSELFVCRCDGYWKTNLSCTLKSTKKSIKEFQMVKESWWMKLQLNEINYNRNDNFSNYTTLKHSILYEIKT